MMVDNLQLEPLSVQFCGELMPQALIDMCSIVDISDPYLTVNPPRLTVPVHMVCYHSQGGIKRRGGGFETHPHSKKTSHLSRSSLNYPTLAEQSTAISPQ